MIRMPRRSVTRFFIPLIDVLTLLFCIFLLMPLIQSHTDGSPNVEPRTPNFDLEPSVGKPEEQNLAFNAEAIRKARRELALLQQQKMETLQGRLLIRVLDIDADTGKLYTTEGGRRMEIDTQSDALRLITRHKQAALNKEAYYLFLFPRKLTGYPEERQLKQYEEWFKDVPHGRSG